MNARNSSLRRRVGRSAVVGMLGLGCVWGLVLGGGLAGLARGAQSLPVIEETFAAPEPPSAAARQREEDLKLAVATHPDRAGLWTDLGWRLYENGRYPECDAVMRQARELAPKDAYVLWLSGLAAYASGHWPEAADYLWPLYRDFDSPAHRSDPPYLEFDVRKISESRGVVDLSKPLPRKPPLPEVIDAAVLYDILGRSLLSRGEYFNACVMLGVACDLRPKDWRSFFFLGYAECRRAKFEPQRYVAAEAALGKARELAPREPLVLRFYAYAKSFSGIKLTPGADLSAAAQAVQQAIAARPEQAPNYHLLTQVRLAQGDSAGAIAAARKAVALNADDGYSLYLLAKALVASRGDQAIGGGDQRVAEAKALLTRSMALDPGLMDESQTAPHAGLLISILLGEGNVQAAEALTNWCVQNGFGQ